MSNSSETNTVANRTFRLRDIVGRKVMWNGRRIGKLADLIFEEGAPIPHVTHFLVHRSFGDPQLSVPIGNVIGIGERAIDVAIESLAQFAMPNLAEGNLLARDFILNKKVIDMEDREVSVVFDVTILQVGRKFYVSGVDLGRRVFFRRLRLGWMADLLHVEEDLVSWVYIMPLPETIGSFRGDVKLNALRKSVADMPPVDLADIIEQLSDDQRSTLLKQLDVETASETLEEIEPSFQRRIISLHAPREVAELVDQMTPPQAADVLSALSRVDAQAILDLIQADLRAKVEAILHEEKGAILSYATGRVISVSEHERIGAVRDGFPALAAGMDFIHYIFVHTPERRICGIVDLRDLLLREPSRALKDVMNSSVVSLSPDDTLRDAQDAFQRYGYRALPILDTAKLLKGVVLFRDIMQLRHRVVD